MPDPSGLLVPAERTCAACGGPLEGLHAGEMCAGCAFAARVPGSELARRREAARVRAALMAELGMPPDAPYFHTTIRPQGGEWNGYTLELLGMDVDRMPWPCPWPFWRMYAPGGRYALVKQIWLRRVRCPDTPAYVEARWHPERGERIAVLGLEHTTRAGEEERALRALALLRHYDERGRPKGGTNLTRAEFLAMYEVARASCLAEGFKPTLNNLTRYLPVSKATLSRYKRAWLGSDARV